MSGMDRRIRRLIEIRTYFCFSNAYRNITTIKYKDIITFCLKL